MNLKQLKQQKVLRQQEIVNTAKTANRSLTAEEQTEFDNLQREIDELTAQIEAEERQAEQTEGNKRAIEDERKRIAEITELCREFGIEADTYVKDGSTVEDVRKAVIEHMRKNSAPINTPGRLDVGTDSEDKFRAAAVDGLLMRGGLDIDKPADGAREFIGMRLRDLAIETLQGEGVSNLNRKTDDDLFEMLNRQFYNPTAAFPSIMDQAINKAYVEGHKQVAVTFDLWTKKGTLKDFKTVENKYLAGPAGEFLEVPEGGEIKHDLPVDGKLPQRKLKTYARQFTMTRQAFINDDIGFLSTVPARYAKSARKTINRQVYNILIQNPAIYDGTPLFGENHKNVIAKGTGITAKAIQRIFMALQLQADQFGQEIIIRPTYIIVPVGYSFSMYTIFESPTINTEDNTQAVNPLYRYRNQITVIEDPTINSLCGGNGNIMPWFVIGDKNDTDFIQVDYLNGQEIPTIRRMETPGTLGFVWDIYLDWGVTVIDWRGAVKNPGIAIDVLADED